MATGLCPTGCHSWPPFAVLETSPTHRLWVCGVAQGQKQGPPRNSKETKLLLLLQRFGHLLTGVTLAKESKLYNWMVLRKVCNDLQPRKTNWGKQLFTWSHVEFLGKTRRASACHDLGEPCIAEPSHRGWPKTATTLSSCEELFPSKKDSGEESSPWR